MELADMSCIDLVTFCSTQNKQVNHPAGVPEGRNVQLQHCRGRDILKIIAATWRGQDMNEKWNMYIDVHQKISEHSCRWNAWRFKWQPRVSTICQLYSEGLEPNENTRMNDIEWSHWSNLVPQCDCGEMAMNMLLANFAMPVVCDP